MNQRLVSLSIMYIKCAVFGGKQAVTAAHYGGKKPSHTVAEYRGICKGYPVFLLAVFFMDWEKGRGRGGGSIYPLMKIKTRIDHPKSILDPLYKECIVSTEGSCGYVEHRKEMT